jgi:hypothetical protein
MYFVINIALVLLGTPPGNGIEFPEIVSVFGEISEERKRRQSTVINTEENQLQIIERDLKSSLNYMHFSTLI